VLNSKCPHRRSLQPHPCGIIPVTAASGCHPSIPAAAPIPVASADPAIQLRPALIPGQDGACARLTGQLDEPPCG